MDFIDHRSTATFQFKISATDEKARIDNSGNLLVGKSATGIGTAGTEVRGVGQLWATRDGGTALALNRLSSDGTIAQFYRDGGSVGVIAAVSADLAIYSTTAGHSGLRFGNGYVASTNNAGTIQNGTISLGLDAYRWSELWLSGNANIGGNATITGDLTVNGTTTTLNTATLDVEDKNITLNYGAGDTSSTADGAGITIQDAVDASNNATILWDATNDEFDFSHPINVTGGITSSGNISGAALIIDSATAVDKISNYMVFYDGSGAPAIYAGNTADNRNYYQSNHHRFRNDDGTTNFGEISSAGWHIGGTSTPTEKLTVTGNAAISGTISSGAITSSGTISAQNSLTVQNSSAYGSIEVGGVSGGFIDIKRPFSDDYDLRLIAEGDGGVINVASGELTIQRAGSAKLATTSTGIAVTGNATFGDNGKAIFGAGSDLQIYHDGSNSFIDDTGTGSLIIRAADNLEFQKYTGETYITAAADGAVDIYYNDARKLATTATGIDVTGSVTADSLTVTGTLGNWSIDSQGAIQSFTRASANYIKASSAGGYLVFQTGGANERLSVNDSGIDVTGSVTADGLLVGATSANYAGVDLTVGDTADSQNGIGIQTSTTGYGYILFGDGTGASAYVGQINYKHDDNYMAFHTAGSEKMRIDSNGKVGIGRVSSSVVRLSVAGSDAGSSNYAFEATNSSLATRFIVRNDGQSQFFKSDNSASMTITNAGNVGIGSIFPAVNLDIVNTASDVQMRVYKNDGTNNTRLTLTADDSGAKIHYRDATNGGALRFNNNAGEMARFDASGNVGIGTSSPATSLHVNSGANGEILRIQGADAQLRINNSTANVMDINSSGSGDSLTLSTNDTERMRIDSSGQVGIGVTPFSAGGNGSNLMIGDPATAVGSGLTIGATTTCDIQFGDATTGTGRYAGLLRYQHTDDVMAFWTASTEAMRIDSSGNLLVNRTSAFTTAKMEIQSDAGDASTLALNSINSDGNILGFYKAGNAVGSIGTAGGDFTVNAQSLGVLQVGGASKYGWTGSLFYPITDNASDLGTSSFRFKDLYLSGTISSGAITSSGNGSFALLQGTGIGVDNTSSTTKHGLSLYGGSGNSTNPTYGIMFTGTSGSGTHGSVTGDWATYFTMNTSAGRGWIFKTQGSANVASISNAGDATFNGTITAGLTQIGQDSTYAGYGVIGFGGRANGSNRVFGHNGTSDGLYLASATGRGIYFRVNGSSANSWQIDSAGNLKAGSGLGTTVINASRQLLNVSVSTTEAEYGQSLNGNFGQWLAHSRYGTGVGFNTDVDYWGWNFVQTSLNAPHTGSSQWYRNRVSLGNAYGHGISTGDYWLEMAYPRTTSSSGQMYIRACENGGIGSWYEVGANIRGNQSVAGNATVLGNVGIGTSSPSSYPIASELVVDTGVSGGITVVSDSTTGGYGGVFFADGTTGNEQYRGFVQYNHNNGGSVDALLFGTSGTEAMRLDSDGNVGIGTVPDAISSNATTLNIKGAVNTKGGAVVLESADESLRSYFYPKSTGTELGTLTNHDLLFLTNTTERTRIDSSGNQLWGKTAANNTTQGIRFLGSSGFMSVVRSSNTLAVFNRIDNDGTLMEFRTNGTTRGSISISGSTTSYNTTSDERLKDNIVDAPSASDDIDAIQVRSFDWKADGSHQKYGMVAQELSAVAPEAVHVPEDTDEMQSVDYSKLVPMMLKEIQSLRARVAQLEGEN